MQRLFIQSLKKSNLNESIRNTRLNKLNISQELDLNILIVMKSSEDIAIS